MRPVVITGIGVASCLGLDAATTWKRLLTGERGYSAAQPLGQAGDLALESSRAIALIERAACEALADAALSTGGADLAVAIGSSRGLQADWESSGGRQNLGLDAPARAIARLIESPGPVSALSCACTSGAWAIGTGYRWIRWGLCDRVLVGATDAAITPLNLAGFRQAGALARTACRPFEREREGFVLSEGAAALVLEAESVAQGRPYARLLAFAATDDAYHLSAPHPEALGLERAVRRCLQDAGLLSADVIHAHGTGTTLGDAAEAKLIARLYGATTPVIAFKASLGHSLGASSAIEAALCCLALRDGLLPPIVGLEHPIAPLAFVREPTNRSPATVLLHSLGFGGQNAALLLEACPSRQGALG
ncbi:beta-ketoacyl synthase N-terminal-like domain-containing protein [Gloeobacter kilaueensis]|uniref:3-oxoacyl-(Acyl carrier protein) synthase II n=1 Tax=Gloeobacter kilaueensis (strain ATCC BAA-2537 / CCAP 1431/1 / ULC 316 / JS1) TaxID=1183438 RepID=U5QGX2_GLOK1|nr:beta-ketoacyl synthase N-terminal-like domain-containing protein [Gloeobacter kilaueensis]AGY56890.1 3-oxoacyl-(acyl carrier protein) synthase II [Gloeobacter kilaueensis JS1]